MIRFLAVCLLSSIICVPALPARAEDPSALRAILTELGGDGDWNRGMVHSDPTGMILRLEAASLALDQGWTASPALCWYWAWRMTHTFSADHAFGEIQSVLGNAAAADLKAAADRAVTMAEQEALVLRHPDFGAVERAALLKRTQAQRRQRALEAAVCSLLAEASPSAPLRQSMAEILAVDRPVFAKKQKSEGELELRIVGATAEAYGAYGKAMLPQYEARVALLPERVVITAYALGPDAHPMVMGRLPRFTAYLEKQRRIDADAVRLAQQAIDQFGPDAGLIVRSSGGTLREIRAALVRITGGADLYAAEVARQMLQDATEEQVFGREFDSPLDVDRRRHTARVLEEAIDAAMAGEGAAARLYAAAPGRRDDPAVWSASWADWDWITEAELADLVRGGRIAEAGGERWLLPPGRAMVGPTPPVGSRALRLGFDGLALKQGKAIDLSPHPRAPDVAGTLNDPWLGALYADALLHGGRASEAAVPLLRQAARSLSGEVLIFEDLGLAQVATGHYTDAVMAFGQMMMLKPSTDDNIIAAYIHALAVRGEYKAAKTRLDRQLATQSDSSKTRKWLAVINVASGEAALAPDDLEQAYHDLLWVADTAAASQANYGALMNYSSALSVLHRLTVTRKFDPLWLKAEEERIQTLILGYMRKVPVLPALPERAIAASREAEAQVAAGHLMGAVVAYGRALDAAPWWGRGYRNLALVYGAMGAEQFAIDTMKMFLEVEPSGPAADGARRKIAQWEERSRVVLSRAGVYRPDIPFPIFPDRE